METTQDPYVAFLAEVHAGFMSGSLKSKDDLQKLKMELASKYSLSRIPSDVEILNCLPATPEEKKLFRIKRTRTISGVAVVAAMTSPEACPHGKCIYCPGGPDINSPQAYTGHEPAALRGRTHNYDPYNQVFHRLAQLETIGHDVSKVDLIVMGGTFTARTAEYQNGFVKGCFDAMNRSLSGSLDESMHLNEHSARRCVGITVETKPDWFMEKDIDIALSYGTTKVELGAQIINDRILKLNHRGHGIEEIRKSTQLARDAGLKIVYHLMPGMYGAEPGNDVDSFRKVCEDQDFRPDMLKIYPTLVVKGTSLYRLWKAGRYTPPTTDEVTSLLTEFMKMIPPWMRIQRVQRDIPVPFIVAGCKRSDIRNIVERKARLTGVRISEIRAREVGIDSVSPQGNLSRVRRDFAAGNGHEVFLSEEDPEGHVAGYLRLRNPSRGPHRPEMEDSSIVREIKVVGEALPIGAKPEGQWQHRGIGKDLIAWAEEISSGEFDKRRLLIISGVGVRDYFRKLGYERVGPYMGKLLSG